MNNEPVTTAPGNASVNAGRAYQHDLIVKDADFDPITYSMTGQPVGMTIDQYGRIRWQTDREDLGANNTARVYTFQVLATDNRGAAEAAVTVSVTVQPDVQAPTGDIYYDPKPGRAGEPVDVFVSAVDNVGVASMVLTVNGTSVTLNDRGIGSFTIATPGSYPAVAVIRDDAGNQTTVNKTIVIASNDPNGPQLVLTSPGDRDVVSAPSSVIGTIDDPGNDLTYYRLDVLTLNGEFLRTIREVDGNGSTITEVINGAIVTLDPTTLANGCKRTGNPFLPVSVVFWPVNFGLWTFSDEVGYERAGAGLA